MSQRTIAVLGTAFAVIVAATVLALRGPTDRGAAGAIATPSVRPSVPPQSLRPTPASSTTAQPSFIAGLPGRFAFATRRTGNFEIYSMAPDGSNLVQLTDDPALDRQPVWSPDGATLLFERDTASGSSIWSMASDGSGARRLGEGSAPQWSPDGSRFVSTTFPASITIRNADGTGAAPVVPRGSVDFAFLFSPSWSADGSRLLFVGSEGNGLGSDIYTMKLDGSDVTQVTSTPPEEASPKISPDGRLLAYLSHFTCLCVATVDGSGAKSVARWNAKGVPIAWSPDSRWIVVAGGSDASTGHGPSNIRVVSFDGSQSGLLTTSNDIGDMSWGP